MTEDIASGTLDALLRVYFDTNVYDRIDKNDVPEPELLALRDALKQGKVIVHPSACRFY